jgi:aminoglycoside phosphotransferase (APT) family kinase protein
VPRFHKTPRWEADTLTTVARQASALLEKELARPGGTPAHWRPMHGDFVPWNLREDRTGTLWLLDWEDAGWGPPYADVVRYAAAYQSISTAEPDQMANRIRAAFPRVPADGIAEAALFWTRHANLEQPPAPAELSAGQTADFRRSRREYDALTRVAGSG